MVVGLVKGQLSVAILKQRLGIDSKKICHLKDLLIEALAKKLLTKEEFDLTVPKQESVIKCYLYSMITDKEYREKIEKYVLASSQLYTRGSYIANLIALKILGPVEQQQDVIPRYTHNLGLTQRLFDMTENDLFKQIFCPERWPSEPVKKKNSKDFRNTSILLEDIKNIVEENRVVMNNLRPDWENVMYTPGSTSGWDNNINRMYSKYRANIQTSLMNHIPAMLIKYLKKVEMANDESRPLLAGMIQRPLRPWICHNNDFEHVVYLRGMFGQEKDKYFPKDFEYTVKLFDFIIGLKRLGLGGGTYLPVCDFGRKYCYIDFKVAKGLLGCDETKGKTFSELFGLTKEALKARKKRLRRELRQRYKKNNKKMKKRWANTGLCSIPRGTTISSFETDGVGMSIVIKKPINIFAVVKKETILLPMNNPVNIGVDDGRAKALTAAISTNNLKKPVHQMLTRKKYYFEMKHNIRMKWERQRTIATNVNRLLSLHPKSTDFAGYLECVNANLQDLRNEYLVDKERAFWRMRLYRLKTRSLDKAIQKLFDVAKGRPIVFGIGNAKFAPNGKGELSMPTTMLTRFFKK